MRDIYRFLIIVTTLLVGVFATIYAGPPQEVFTWKAFTKAYENEADLAVTKAVTSNPVKVFNPLTYTITITNAGPDAATGVVLYDVLPVSTNLAMVSSPQGSCSGTSTITCTFTTIAASNTAMVTLVVTPTATGLITNTVSVTATEVDNNSADNVDVVSTMVNSVIPTTILLTPNPASIDADGASTSTISGMVWDQFDDPVPDGTNVTFETDLGSLDSLLEMTIDGYVTVTLTSIITPGTATITATSGSAITNTMVVFVDVTTPTTISLVANPTAIDADGVSTSALSATVWDQFGNPIADGTNVTFATNLGTLDSTLQTTLGGVATATLTSDVIPGTANITATSASASDSTTVMFSGIPTTVTLTANPTSIPGNGTSTSMLTAMVVDAIGNPVADGTVVGFETDLGSIGVATTTTVSGMATTTLTSAAVVGTANLTASVDTLFDNATVNFTPYPATVALIANPTSIPGDGVSTSLLTATIDDQQGNPVPDGTEVYFATDRGTLDVITTTTVSGVATATLTANISVGTANLVAGSGATGDNTTVEFTAYAASLTLTASPTSIPGDGVSISTLTATVDDQQGNPMPDGTSVNFTTDLGTLSAASANTVGGVAEVTLTSAVTIGTATIDADAGAMTDSATVDFTAYPANVILTADPTSIPGDGISTSTLTVMVEDQLGNPIADGTDVSFSTDLGTLSVTSTTTISGMAEITLTSAVAAGTANVSATAGSTTGNTTVEFTAYPASVVLTADPTSIPGDGVSTSTLSAQVDDQSGNPISDGTVVFFTTDLGTLGVVTGTLSVISSTTLSGIATATLTSEVAIGTANLTADAGDVSDTATVDFTAYPASVVLTANPTSIPGDGSSTSTLTAVVEDQLGNSITDGTAVSFSTDLGTLSAASANTVGGVAEVTLTSVVAVGTANVSATADSVNDTATVEFTAYPASLTLTASPGSIPGDGSSTSTISAEVNDQVGNPVPDGMAISFSTDLGSLSAASANTVGGVAEVTLTSAITVGTANLSATASGLTDTTTVAFTAYAASLSLSADPSSIPGDGSSSATISAMVADQLGNPVSDGMLINFSTDLGTLSAGSTTTVGGVAQLTLTSAVAVGTANLTASSGSLSDTTTVDFTAYAVSITVTANPTSIPADGSSTSAIEATVTDQEGNPMPDGTVVTFQTTLGTLDAGAGSLNIVTATTTSGVAGVTLISATSTGTATVTTSIDSINDTVDVEFTPTNTLIYLPVVLKQYTP